ncbi:MAG: F0F1 ATP synthase subunit B' [Robiginitomaculum sp.]|nr:F0F1 ATP synthase subunit B' [Robiginitomaculum sp.]
MSGLNIISELLNAMSGATAPYVSMLAEQVSGQASKLAYEQEKLFAPLDPATFSSQIFWLLLSFGVLLFLLAKVLLPRLGGILEERSNRIADDIDAASRMQKKAELAGKAYEQSLGDARAKAHNVAETTRASVNAELEAEMQTADAETAIQMERAEAKIQKTRAAALANVDDIASETAKAVVEHLYTKKISITTVRKTVKTLGQSARLKTG